MLLNIILGLSIFVITNASLLYASHLVVRRFFSQARPSVRLVAIATLFYALIILIFQALSPFHAITKLWVTVTCLLIALSTHLAWGYFRNFNADIEPIRTWIRDGLNSRWAALIIVCGFVALLSFSRALLMPPLSWDCLTYHLTFAALWIKKGTLVLFSAPDQLQYAHFPINGELFAAWLLLPFHTDLLVNTMNFPLTILGGTSCYAIARELGLSRKEAGFAPVLLCFAPMVYSLITTQYVDTGVFAFCSAAVLFVLRYLKEGFFSDSILALVAAGIVLGIKFTGVPVVGLIFIGVIAKTVSSSRCSGFSRKMGIALLGLLILSVFGGRQYILNTIDARNPFYPLPVRIMNFEIVQGWSGIDEMNEWISEYEISTNLDKLSLWERIYRKFCYLPLTAGPKFFLFFILALASFLVRPQHIPKRYWYFLSVMWIVPVIVYFASTSMDFAKRGYYLDRNTRFLSPYIALITLQGLAVVSRIKSNSRAVDFFLLALFFWDLLYINKTHSQEVRLLYPFVIVLIPIGIIFYYLVCTRLSQIFSRGKSSSLSKESARLEDTTVKKWPAYVVGLMLFVTVLYYLQSYRDNTRYSYYQAYSDLNAIPRDLVDGWEFLDSPDEKKTIAMAMDWQAPGHNWFFYPLLGRWLQNDVVYLSAKYKWAVPVWLHRGMLRGNDFSIWSYNLEKEKVDYILVRTPWPIELAWMNSKKDKFQLVFSDRKCKIFRFKRKKA